MNTAIIDLVIISTFLTQITETDEVQIIPEIEFCRSHHMTLFVGCIYAYKGILMVWFKYGILCTTLQLLYNLNP